MDEQLLTKQLQDEGFDDVYVWEDGPDMNYPPHQHPDVSAHIILTGEMTVTVDGQTRTYKPGERFDIPGQDTALRAHGPGGLQIPGRGKIVIVADVARRQLNRHGNLWLACRCVELATGDCPANPYAIPPNLFGRRPPFSWPPHEPIRACAWQGRGAHF